jgi:hydroxymethylpyrimidine/phosphomethylpyrimidine kinase
LQVFRDFGYHGLSVITAVVAQSTRGVRNFEAVPRVHVADQIETLLDDIRPHAVKIGMVPNPETAQAIGGKIPGFQGSDARPVIYDPVLASGSGDSRLVRRGTRPALVRSLIPKVDWLMPNLTEARDLLETAVSLNAFSAPPSARRPPSGDSPDAVVDDEGPQPETSTTQEVRRLIDKPPDALTRNDAETIAGYLCSLGPTGVVLTAGHLPAAQTDSGVSDLLVSDEQTHWCAPLPSVESDVRGTGCQLSSAFTSLRADARPPVDALEQARHYLNDLLRHRSEYIGTGRPVVVRMPGD